MTNLPPPDVSASIIISRKSSIGGAGNSFNILLDGKPAGKVDNGKTVTLAVSPGLHTVYIALPIVHRNNRTDEVALDLTRGGTIKLTCGYKAPGLVYLQKA